MVRLSREIRFALVPSECTIGTSPSNSWAGWPSTNLIAPHLILRCVVEGTPDPQTGFVCNINVIDERLRSIVIDHLIPMDHRRTTAETIIQIAFREVSAGWNSEADLVSVSLALSPFLSYSIALDDAMNQLLPRLQLTQQFEFSAAHRLQCDELSESANQTLFGKCNNREGHGHNYVVEVTVSNEVNPDDGQVVSLSLFESTVKRLVIDRLDHQHLNRDVEYFSAINPTVENIAIAIYDWLDGQFGETRLDNVKVFETPKTWAQYSG